MTPGGQRGARRREDIPADRLDALHRGERSTANLVEFLAVDPGRLLQAVVAQLDLDPEHPALQVTWRTLPHLKPMQRHWTIARTLLPLIVDDAQRQRRLAEHPSDIARQWAALFPGLRVGRPLAERLAAARPFAADPHFAVREMAWLAVRQPVIAELDSALALLQPWVHDEDPNLRRFASELTRPRGVWCAHIEALKRDPAPGLPLLEPLRADPSRYVRDSVANWLNDAGKTCPDWTRAVCADWLAASPTAATRQLCARALRNLRD